MFYCYFVSAGNLFYACPFLTNPVNGLIICSLGDDGIPTHGDTCSFTCNSGYEIIGLDTRMCQSDKSWSGPNIVCRRGKYQIKVSSAFDSVTSNGTLPTYIIYGFSIVC